MLVKCIHIYTTKAIIFQAFHAWLRKKNQEKKDQKRQELEKRLKEVEEEEKAIAKQIERKQAAIVRKEQKSKMEDAKLK